MSRGLTKCFHSCPQIPARRPANPLQSVSPSMNKQKALCRCAGIKTHTLRTPEGSGFLRKAENGGRSTPQTSQKTKLFSLIKTLSLRPAALRSAHADGLSAPLAAVAVLYRSMLCTDPVGQSSKMISRGKKAAVNKRS